MQNFFKKWLSYIIASIVGLAIFVAIICRFEIWNAAGIKYVMQILTDACFVPGVLLAGVGLIIFASNGGAFDMLAFAVIRIFDLFKKDCKNSKYKDFYEYHEAKKDVKRPMAFMLIIGTIFIILAVIFYGVYCVVKKTQ